ncbi:hypothetical protein GPJ56_007629 [Histomonas meleagridis]|uniref:uncharacterized protein n=1 Tax=Histomonas meleagridis TaxID=135588 RepID=UPI00355A0C1F|nr:hypothetical protein GPJ56_007629 [Histomonas meleagridis]KAH0799456.1 hypothetical protein GO595_007857 [Histomonas meleagridis]
MQAYPNQSPPVQTIPRTVYIRVRKVYIPGSHRSIQKNLFIQNLPEGSGVISPLGPSQVHNFYITNSVPAFRYTSSSIAQVSFKIMEMRQGYGEFEISKMILPLGWFAPNMVTHYVFPFITKTPEKGQPMIELDVHLSENNSPPFIAPQGNLLVMPMWQIPPELNVDLQRQPRKENYARPGYPAGPQVASTKQKSSHKAPKTKKSNQKIYAKISSDSEDELETLDHRTEEQLSNFQKVPVRQQQYQPPQQQYQPPQQQYQSQPPMQQQKQPPMQQYQPQPPMQPQQQLYQTPQPPMQPQQHYQAPPQQQQQQAPPQIQYPQPPMVPPQQHKDFLDDFEEIDQKQPNSTQANASNNEHSQNEADKAIPDQVECVEYSSSEEYYEEPKRVAVPQ